MFAPNTVLALPVSVIIPAYNRAHCLPRALDSVLGQTRPAAEIIVMDDGSSDHSAELLARKYPEVRYLYQHNQGVSAARNRAIEQSTQDWIALLDSDDAWLPEKLEQQFAAVQEKPAYKICHTEEIWIRRGRRVNAMNKHKKHGGRIYQHCLPLCAMSPSSILIHRSIFDEVGLFDESLPACEDYDLWLRICSRWPVLFLPTPLIEKYGGHEDQLSARYWGMDRFRIRALQKQLQSTHLGAQDYEATRQMLLSKASIYLQGALKRNKLDEVEHYQRLIRKYEAANA